MRHITGSSTVGAFSAFKQTLNQMHISCIEETCQVDLSADSNRPIAVLHTACSYVGFAAGAVFRLAKLEDEKLSFNVDTEPDTTADASMSMKNLSHLSSAAISCGRREASFIALRGTA